jgi:hypothetical protein
MQSINKCFLLEEGNPVFRNSELFFGRKKLEGTAAFKEKDLWGKWRVSGTKAVL